MDGGRIVGNRDSIARRPGQGAWRRGAWLAAALGAAVVAAGCSGVAQQYLPNSDPSLRKSRADFAADAARRFPFKTDAPSGGRADGRAVVDYGHNFIELANVSNEDWNDVEIWLNQKYVVFVGNIPGHAARTKVLNFYMFYDAAGQPFPTNNASPQNMIHQLQMLRDGKMYTIDLDLADQGIGP